ncbi:hypothetical protein MNBD_GAMMA12-1277 [hydrothermal vent metagenome]|uniref:Uncharacterized protein n=1 Tax=hydrothermal vent metagenome TaxID=652676 RepID=A0A3B0Y2L4_9ZZZZ
MAVEMETPIKIVAIGLDLRSTKRLSTIFTVIYKGKCELSEGVEAVLAIVDLDGSADAWSLYQRQYSGLPVIIMSETIVEIEGAIFISKPAKLDPLWECIYSLANTMPKSTTSEHNVGNGKDTKGEDNNKIKANQSLLDSDDSHLASTQNLIKNSINDAAKAMDVKISANSSCPNIHSAKNSHEGESIYFDLDSYLLGHLISIVNDDNHQNCLIHIHCWLDRLLILNTGEGKAYTNLSDSQLKYLGVVPCKKDFTIEDNSGIANSESSLEKNNSQLRVVSIEYLLWDLTLRTARGRVPQGIDLTRLYYLKCWPNFPRLPNTPHGMRIASVWVNNPCRLDDIAEKLDIPLADVYTFYSATFAIGFSGLAKRKADYLVESPVLAKKESPKRGLFASIIRSLVHSGH